MSGLYKYVMPGAGNPNWRAKTGLEEAEANGEQFFLKDGGELFALRVVAEDSKDMRGGFADGQRFNIQWVKVQNPTAPNSENRQEVFDSAPGAAIFSRGEGAWYENGLIYFVSTNGGEIREGQVWVIDPLTNKLTMQYESRDRADVDGPDNLAVAPNGSIILVRCVPHVFEECLKTCGIMAHLFCPFKSFLISNSAKMVAVTPNV